MEVLDENRTPEDYEARRPMLLAAIADTEGTIQATDTKASIALVFHGLIFTAVGNNATAISLGSGGVRATAIIIIAAMVPMFALSVAQLIRCVMPTPARVFSGIEGGHDVFFIQARADPRTGAVHGLPKVADVQRGLVSLDRGELEEELVVELVALSAVRARKIALVGDGLRWLAIEIGLALLVTIVLGINAI